MNGPTQPRIAAVLALALLTGCGGAAQRALFLSPLGGGGQSSDSNSGQSSDGSSDGSSQGGGGGGGMPGSTNKSGTSESGPSTRDGESKSESKSDDDVASASVVFLSLLSLATVVLIVYLGYVSTREVSAASGPAVPPPAPAELERLSRKARDYLVTNRRSLRASLARGDGPFVVELAGALDLPVPLRPRLGEVIQAHHAQLDPWLEGLDAAHLDPQAALGFGRALAAALDADP